MSAIFLLAAFILAPLWAAILSFAAHELLHPLEAKPKPSSRNNRHRHAARPLAGMPLPVAHPADGRRKPEWVPDVLSAIVIQVPGISCRNLKLQFDLMHRGTDVTIGKTYAAVFLKTHRRALANPRCHAHGIDTAGKLLRAWALDLTEARIMPRKPQPVLGLIEHASRQVLRLQALRDKKTITILRILLDAIEHYGKPKAIRTDNEAIFTSWVFAFALRWLGIRHQRTKPHCPWMNGRIERFWRTLKDALKLFDISNEAELQATLEMLKMYYNQHRPHQSLSGLTPDQAAAILKLRAGKPPPRR
jgi:putative transposase